MSAEQHGKAVIIAHDKKGREKRRARPPWGCRGGDWSVDAAEIPERIDVAALRRREGLTQAAFAKRYGFSPAFIRDYEQARKPARLATLAYLRVIEAELDAVRRALNV